MRSRRRRASSSGKDAAGGGGPPDLRAYLQFCLYLAEVEEAGLRGRVTLSLEQPVGFLQKPSLFSSNAAHFTATDSTLMLAHCSALL